MSFWKPLAVSATVAAAMLIASPAKAPAQISIGIGLAPVCPYGYFDYAPYDCAPYGYYGPDWFNGGLFIGAGPWFHGPRGFYGHVDNRYDPHNGYRGPVPERGAQAFDNFHGNEARDAHGNVGQANHSAGGEHALQGYHGGGSTSHSSGGSHGGSSHR
jgi:hypothetical protein